MLQSFVTGERHSLGDLLDGAIRVYRDHFGPLALTSAVFLAPIGVLATLVFGIVMGSLTDLFLVDPLASTPSDADPLLNTALAYLLVSLLGYICVALAFVCLTAQVLALLNGEPIGLGESVRRGLRRLLPFVGLVLLYGLIITVLMTILYIVFGVLAFGLTMLFGFGAISFAEFVPALAVGMAVVLAMLYVAALLVVFAPVGFVTARWIAAPTVVVAENEGPISAFGRSWRLTDHHAWRCFGYLFLLAFFNFEVLGLPVGVIQMLMTFFLPAQLAGTASGLVMGLSYFMNIIWYPLLVLALVLLYYDLRVRTEGFDLDLRISQLEEDVRRQGFAA